MAKERLDVLVHQLGLAESREKAKTLIMMGHVFVGNNREDKPGTKVPLDVEITVKGKPNPYVSRGGLKLEKAMKQYGIDLTGCICMDIGASTGGFTDCMLQNGASKVYAIDVGYGQLAWKLRQDERVVVLEKTNVRYVTQEQVKDQADFFSVDVSFISLTKVIPAVQMLLKNTGKGVCLIKPQFEAGRDKVGKKGVVKDPLIHMEVNEHVCHFLMQQGFHLYGLDYSPIKGPEGNIEYLAYIGLMETPGEIASKDLAEEIKKVVDNAHFSL